MVIAVGLFVWPVLCNLSSCVGGREFSEVWGHLWAYWIFPHMLFVRHAWPLWIDIVNVPEGLFLYPADPLHLIVVTAFRSVLGLVAAYNVLMIGALLLTAWATYLLAYELCRVRKLAVVAGIMVALSPYLRASYIDNYTESMGVYWIALVFLNLVLNCRSPSVKRGVFGGLLFAGLFYTNMYYTVVTGVGYVAAAVWSVLLERRRRGFRLLVLTCAPVVGLILSVPGILLFMNTEPGRVSEGDILAEFVKSARVPISVPSESEWSYAVRIAAESASRDHAWFHSPGSVDMAAYLPPSGETQFAHPKGLLCAVYPGLLAQLCLGVFLVVRRKRLGGFFIAAMLAGLLSLGIFPSWQGSPLIVHDARPMAGPFYWLVNVFPFFSDLTQTYRFSVIVTLLASCAAAVVASRLWRRGTYGRWLGGLLMVGCFADTLLFGMVPFPVPTVTTAVNPAFEWIRAREDASMVLEWPSWKENETCDGNRVPAEKAQYHQTLHQHPIGPFADVGGLQWMELAPGLFWNLAALTPLSPRPQCARPEGDGCSARERKKMAALGYGYFVAHMWAVDPMDRDGVKHCLIQWFGKPESFSGDVDVYTIAEGS